MLSDNTIKLIADVFIGDGEDLYSYKKGYELVEFFNENFEYEDKYGQGFPSRWQYVTEKIKELFVLKKIDDFFSIILGKTYFMKDSQTTEIEALESSKRAISLFNKQLLTDGYIINSHNGKYFLKKQEGDLEFLDSGGYANVYYRKSTNEVYKKLKDEWMIDEGIRSRFKREYEITKTLQDMSGIIRLYDYYKGECAYGMEKADFTLNDFIKSNTNLSKDEKKEYIIQLLSTMSEVHRRNIIHRDLSPKNIFLINSEIKISDFGLGKNLSEVHSYQTLKTNGVGQYMYCSPEQMFSLKSGDMRSDVFSLGKVVNFIITSDPNNDNHHLRSIVIKATQKESTERYISAQEMLDVTLKIYKILQNRNLKEEARNKIKEQVLDLDVENYIYELSGEELCSEIISTPTFEPVLINLMKMTEENATLIINQISENYRAVCLTWKSYDPIASFVTIVLQGNFSFGVKEKSATILHDIAFNARRFNSQRVIERLIEQGMEPLIEEILLG